MKKVLLVFITLLSSAALSFAQYAVKPSEDITLSKEVTGSSKGGPCFLSVILGNVDINGW